MDMYGQGYGQGGYGPQGGQYGAQQQYPQQWQRGPAPRGAGGGPRRIGVGAAVGVAAWALALGLAFWGVVALVSGPGGGGAQVTPPAVPAAPSSTGGGYVLTKDLSEQGTETLEMIQSTKWEIPNDSGQWLAFGKGGELTGQVNGMDVTGSYSQRR